MTSIKNSIKGFIVVVQLLSGPSLIAQNASCGSTYATDGGTVSITQKPNNPGLCILTFDLAPGETFNINDDISDVLTIDGGNSDIFRLVINGGTVTVNGSIQISNNANAAFEVEGAGNLVITGDFINEGNSNSLFDVSGTISIQGNVDLGDKGDLTVQSGGGLEVGGTLSTAGADVDISGTLTANNIDNSGGGTVTTSGGGTISANSCTGTCGDVGIVTPIELLSFSANYNSSHVEVSWTTESEINNDFFTLERSSDGVSFESIARIKGAGTSSEPLSYKFVDRPSFNGILYYRLQQTDFDGSSESFEIVRVNTMQENTIHDIAFSPTITTPAASISTPNIWGIVTEAKIYLLSLSGRQIPIAAVETSPARVSLAIPASLSKEMYLLRGTINGIPISGKIIVK